MWINQPKEHDQIVADIFARTALKPTDLIQSSRLHLRKLGKSEADHWLAFVEKTKGSAIASSGVVHSLIDLIVQASLGSKPFMYQELREAVETLSRGIDPELTRKKLASMSEWERQTIQADAKKQEAFADETAYKLAVRQQAIKTVFG